MTNFSSGCFRERCRIGGLVLLVGLILVTHPAEAQSEGGLTWEAPSCPPQWKLENRVKQLLGKSLESARAPKLDVLIRTDPVHGFSLRLQVGDGDDAKVRELKGADCDQLVDAAALSIALLLEPDLDIPEETMDGTSEPEPVFSAQIEENDGDDDEEREATPPASKSEPAPRPKPSWRLGVGPVLDLQALGGPAPGATSELQVRFLDRVSARFSLVGLPHHRVDDEASGRFLLLGGGLRLCDHLERGWAVAAVCAGMEAGVVRGRTVGSSSSGGVGRWLAPLGGISAGAKVGRTELLFVGEALFPLFREKFLSGEILVHQLPAVSGRLGFFVSTAFR